jgi:parallel beta-helix repeat protein
MPVYIHGDAVILKIIAPSDIATGSFTISEAGLYVLGNDSTISTGTALTIATSDVTLDLNGKTIRGTGAVTGIAISEDLQNVFIKNGKIFGSFTTNGVLVNSGNQNINIEDLVISGSSNNSLSFSGINLASGTPRTTHVSIQHCRINNSQTGISMSQSNDVTIENTICNFNGTGVHATSCNNIYVQHCRASNNTTASSDSSYGMLIESSRVWAIQNSEFNFNQSSVRGTGLSIASNSGNIMVEDCRFCANGATGSSSSQAEGLSIALSSSCFIKDSVANGNFSTTSTAAGMRIDTGGFSNLLDNCSAAANAVDSASFNAYGFMIEGPVMNISLNNCIAEGNGAISPAVGIGFFIGSEATNCFVRNSQASFNSGFGVETNSLTGYLVGNTMIGQNTNFTGTGIFGVVEVNNGSTPPKGTFDERFLNNIAIGSIA